MRHSRHLRLTFLACAVATTMVVGAKSVTNAAGGVDPLVAGELTYDGRVYRDSHYRSGADQRIELSASGGSGTLTYRIVTPPTSGGENIGSVDLEGDVATVTIQPTADPGPASFDYQVVDEEGRRSNVATVSFEVENRLPLTDDLTLTTTQDTPLDLWPYARDAEDGGPFPWQSEGNRISYGKPRHGRITALFAGHRNRPDFAAVGHKAVYVPDTGYAGPDTFSYRFTDAEGGTSTGSVAVDVTPPPVVRPSVADVLYRCPVRVKVGANGESDPAGTYDPDATRIVSRVLGGDLAFGMRVRLREPHRLQPGEPYTLPRASIGLRLSRSSAEMLAGEDGAGSSLDLGSVGLGQTALAAHAAAELHITETGTRDEYDAPLAGLQSEPVALELPAPEDGVTVAIGGTLPTLTAPERGAVVVSMPRDFDLDAEFDPGIQGVMSSVGLRCHAVGGQDLQLARVPVRARTRTTVNAPRTAYGERVPVTVEVSGRADGRVRVFEDTTVLAAAAVTDGRATIRLPRGALEPGSHRLRVAFDGARGYADSTGRATPRVDEPAGNG